MNNSTATTAPSAIQQAFDQAQLDDIADALNADHVKPARQFWHPDHNMRYRQGHMEVMEDMGYKWCFAEYEDGSENLYFFLEYTDVYGFECTHDTLGVDIQIDTVWEARLLYGHWPIPPHMTRGAS